MRSTMAFPLDGILWGKPAPCLRTWKRSSAIAGAAPPAPFGPADDTATLMGDPVPERPRGAALQALALRNHEIVKGYHFTVLRVSGYLVTKVSLRAGSCRGDRRTVAQGPFQLCKSLNPVVAPVAFPCPVIFVFATFSFAPRNHAFLSSYTSPQTHR